MHEQILAQALAYTRRCKYMQNDMLSAFETLDTTGLDNIYSYLLMSINKFD